ncbi:MAG: hypothetical protein A2Z14_17845 [Chloroflexi bacterium RBG_16_48_8]|nr:MAG: hypothetical protein A2Z14_17845 [Chloroflexi bacterium RBG_16_48_8]
MIHVYSLLTGFLNLLQKGIPTHPYLELIKRNLLYDILLTFSWEEASIPDEKLALFRHSSSGFRIIFRLIERSL